MWNIFNLVIFHVSVCCFECKFVHFKSRITWMRCCGPNEWIMCILYIPTVEENTQLDIKSIKRECVRWDARRFQMCVGCLLRWRVLTGSWKTQRCLIVHMRKKAEECEAGRATGKPQAFGLLSDWIKSVCHYLCPCVPRQRERESSVWMESHRNCLWEFRALRTYFGVDGKNVRRWTTKDRTGNSKSFLWPDVFHSTEIQVYSN